MLKQTYAVTAMNLRSIRQRFWASLVIVVGMACVVGVLLSMMSFTAGISAAFAAVGSPDNAIVMSNGVQNEGQSNLQRDAFPLIANAPAIARDAAGKPMADPELLSPIPMTAAGGGDSTMFLRSIGPQGLALRPQVKLVAGHMFRPGSREMVVGRAAQDKYEGTALGDKIILPDGQWPIVGVFTSGGDAMEGSFLADTDTAMTAMHKTTYQSVLVKLAHRADFETLRRSLTTNPALGGPTVQREPAYYQSITGDFTSFINILAYIMSGIMAVGAVFGALNTMYAAVATRTREIATLRALGFSTVSVVISVLAEALLLALAGALIGAAIAWLLFDGHHKALGANVFTLVVTPRLVLTGIFWALVVGMLGGLFPAIRAVRQPVATSLRAT